MEVLDIYRHEPDGSLSWITRQRNFSSTMPRQMKASYCEPMDIGSIKKPNKRGHDQTWQLLGRRLDRLSFRMFAGVWRRDELLPETPFSTYFPCKDHWFVKMPPVQRV